VVTISRTPAGSTVRTNVRGADERVAIGDTLLVVDTEQPFGVELTYRLSIDETDADLETVTTTLAGGKVVLSDAVSGDAVEVVVLSWPSKRRDRPGSVFAVGGRNIVVSGQRGGFSGTIELFTETDESKNAVLNLLDSATAGILQIRQAGPYDGVDSYFYVQSDDEVRYSQDGSDERRTIALDVIETRPWAPTLGGGVFDLGDIAAAYTGETLADLAADYATLLLIAMGSFE
jgi:hypothetical protein